MTAALFLTLDSYRPVPACVQKWWRKKRQRTQYKEEPKSWIADLQTKKRGFQDELAAVQNRLKGCETAPPTRAWQWAAAAEAARRPEAKEFLTLMAAHKVQQEAFSHQEHQAPPGDFGFGVLFDFPQVHEGTLASRSSNRPGSPAKQHRAIGAWFPAKGED